MIIYRHNKFAISKNGSVFTFNLNDRETKMKFKVVSFLTFLICSAVAYAQSKVYVIKLKDNLSGQECAQHIVGINDFHAGTLTPEEARRAGKQRPFGVFTEYNFGSFKGYAADIKEQTIDVIRQRPEVDLIEEDKPLRQHGVAAERVVQRAFSIREQKDAPWGLARISHADPGAGRCGEGHACLRHGHGDPWGPP